MSVRHMGLVLDHFDGPAHLKLTLLILADHADGDTGECYPSYRAIAARACCTERTAMRNVAALVEGGYVEYAERGGRIWDKATEQWLNATNLFRVVDKSLSCKPNLREEAKRRPRKVIHRRPVDNATRVTPGPDTGVTPSVRKGGDADVTGNVIRTVIHNRQSAKAVDNIVAELARRMSS